MKKNLTLGLILTAVFILALLVQVMAQVDIRPATQTEGRGDGVQIRPANHNNLPTDGNGGYVPTQGASYSSKPAESGSNDNGGSSGGSSDNVVKMKSNLNNTNIVNTTSNATGNAIVNINKDTNTISYNISMTELSSNETEAYLMGPFVPELNNSIIFSLPLGTEKSGEIIYEKVIEPYLLSGEIYIKIMSLLFPTGEIAGNVVPI